jgi:NADPH-dependent F420 reductase
MKIAILGGTGALGLGLASRWIRSGHEVLIGSRTIESAKSACGKLNINEDQGMLNVNAASQAEIACLTVPFSFQLDILSEVKDALSGKILIDGTVPLVPPKVMRVQLPEEGCAAIRAQTLLGDSVQVISAFQNISAELLQTDAEIDCDVLVCGDKRDSREQVIALVNDAGLTGWHAGPLCNSAAAEALTSVLIAINKNHTIKHSGIKITGV